MTSGLRFFGFKSTQIGFFVVDRTTLSNKNKYNILHITYTYSDFNTVEIFIKIIL